MTKTLNKKTFSWPGITGPENIFILVFFLLTLQVQGQDNRVYSYLYKDLPIDIHLSKQLQFSTLQVSITDFECVSDGIIINTGAFAKALDCLFRKAGGTLFVSSGVWFTVPVERDHIELQQESITLKSLGDNPLGTPRKRA